jgi:hypothetical protein
MMRFRPWPKTQEQTVEKRKSQLRFESWSAQRLATLRAEFKESKMNVNELNLADHMNGVHEEDPVADCSLCINEFVDKANVAAERRASYVVALYHQEMAYGGREEGDWWYDRGTLVRVLKVFRNSDRAHEYGQRLNQRLKSRKFGPNKGARPYSSVLSDGEYRAHVMDSGINGVPTYFPAQRPHYE